MRQGNMLCSLYHFSLRTTSRAASTNFTLGRVNSDSALVDDDVEFTSAPRKSRLSVPQLQAQLSRLFDRTRLRRPKNNTLLQGCVAASNEDSRLVPHARRSQVALPPGRMRNKCSDAPRSHQFCKVKKESGSTALLSSVMKCDVDIRQVLCGNFVFSVARLRFNGFFERVTKESTRLLHPR